MLVLTSWLRDDGGGETSDKTRSKVDSGLHSAGGSALVEALPDSLSDLFVAEVSLVMRANGRD